MTIIRQLQHAKALSKLQQLRRAVCSRVLQAVAVKKVTAVLERRLLQLRSVRRVQAHTRGYLTRVLFSRAKAHKRSQDAAVAIIYGCYMAKRAAARYKRTRQSVILIQLWVRRYLAMRYFRRVRVANVTIQRWRRTWVARVRFRKRARAARQFQAFYRFTRLRQWYLRKSRAVDVSGCDVWVCD